VLRACRRVLKPGGRIAYFNIFISHDVPQEEQRYFARFNRGQYSRAEQAGLLRSAGFVRIEETDVSPEYLRVQRALYQANERHARSLRRALGAARFEEHQANRQRTLRGIETGVLRRALFFAERPARGV